MKKSNSRDVKSSQDLSNKTVMIVLIVVIITSVASLGFYWYIFNQMSIDARAAGSATLPQGYTENTQGTASIKIVEPPVNEEGGQTP